MEGMSNNRSNVGCRRWWSFGKLTVQSSREASQEDGINHDASVCHVDQSTATGFWIEIGLVDVISKN